MKNAFLFLVGLLLPFFIFSTPALGVSCSAPAPGSSEEEIQAIIDECSRLVDESHQQATSLSQQIAKMDNQIKLTLARISQTKVQIGALEKEIDALSGKIDRLDSSLNYLSEVLLSRVAENYKTKRISPIALFFSSQNFSDFIVRYHYLQAAQLHDRELLISMEQTRLNYDEQKALKEKAQADLEKLQKQLVDQNQQLAMQMDDKKKLLEETKGKESNYQSLLAKAKAQLAAIHRFVEAQGGASILYNQTQCDSWGCYYNQRDSQWGNIGMGGSPYTVAGYGCLISSVSMIASHYGKNIKPNDIALNSSAFVPGTGYLYHSFIVNGVNVSLSSASRDILDSELAAGHPVIAGLYSGPDHFIVILRKDGDKYIMHDPFLENGNNRPLTDKYQYSDINSLRLVSFN